VVWRLAYFLMPSVSGVTKEVTDIFTKQPKLGELWRSDKGVITRYHQEIFTFLANKRMNDLVEKLRAGVEEYAGEIGLSLGPFGISPPPDTRP
jgi:hypothetical protein